MTGHIIIGNFGNHSLAVMQALLEKDLSNIHFCYVETGWAAACWAERVAVCSEYAQQQGVIVHPLKPPLTFSEIVRDRKQFPSPKFQWCTSFLKGLAILNYLDCQDPSCEAVIVSGKRQLDSRRYANLQEFDDVDNYYQGRKLWYPLWQTSDTEFLALIERTGFPFLGQQSLECSPCIHSKVEELSRIDKQALARLQALEAQLGQTMYQYPINNFSTLSRVNSQLDEKKMGLEYFDRGCGAPWGCGE